MLRAKAVEVLLECLQDGSEEMRRHAVEGLGAVGDAESLKEFLSTLKDQDWWVTVRVADAFGAYGGTKIVGTVLSLLKEEDSFIRQCAFEILHTVKDEQAFGSLVRALKDKEIRERAVDALTALGDKRAIPVFVSMLEGDDIEATFIAIRALVSLGDPQAIQPLLVQFDNPDESIKREALRAVAVLTDEGSAQDVLLSVMSVRDNSTGELKVLANKMATSIIKRFGAKVMPQRSLKKVSGADAESNDDPSYDGTLSGDHIPGSQTPLPTTNEDRQNGESLDVVNLQAGVVLADRYRVVRRVGQGGF
jgi:serine/threonine-protein kinase